MKSQLRTRLPRPPIDLAAFQLANAVQPAIAPASKQTNLVFLNSTLASPSSRAAPFVCGT
eukprot:7382499-Prymnesium_polylepis.3